MYKVADDMIRLEYISEMKVSAYTKDDIEYLKKQLNSRRSLISEGAELVLYTSCKYLVASIASEYQQHCMMEPISRDIPKDVRLLFYNCSRKFLPEIFQEYKSGDLELTISKKLSFLYSRIIKEKMGIDL